MEMKQSNNSIYPLHLGDLERNGTKAIGLPISFERLNKERCKINKSTHFVV